MDWHLDGCETPRMLVQWRMRGKHTEASGRGYRGSIGAEGGVAGLL